MQALFLALTELLLHDMLHALLLVLARHRHVGVNLRGSTGFHGHGHLVEAFEQGIAFKIVVQQHAAQVGMASESDAIHIIRFALQPVRSRPDRDHAIHFWLFMIEAHLDLQQLVARESSADDRRFPGDRAYPRRIYN